METQHATLKQTLTEAMKTAMKAQDKPRLAIIRLMQAAIKQREVDERIVLDDNDVMSILHKMLKQRRDSISQYQSGGRQDLADQEAFEITIIQSYLPAPMSAAELTQLVAQAITASAATSAADMGKVMAILKPQIQGRADLSVVSRQVKTSLS